VTQFPEEPVSTGSAQDFFACGAAVRFDCGQSPHCKAHSQRFTPAGKAGGSRRPRQGCVPVASSTRIRYAGMERPAVGAAATERRSVRGPGIETPARGMKIAVPPFRGQTRCGNPDFSGSAGASVRSCLHPTGGVCCPRIRPIGCQQIARAFLTPRTKTVAWALARATYAPHYPKNTAFFNQRKSVSHSHSTFVPRVIFVEAPDA